MDNEMIDRISKAIIETPNASDYEYLVVRNVLRAMREPTEKMWKTKQPMWSLGRPMWDWWRLMIDSITND